MTTSEQICSAIETIRQSPDSYRYGMVRAIGYLEQWKSEVESDTAGRERDMALAEAMLAGERAYWAAVGIDRYEGGVSALTGDYREAYIVAAKAARDHIAAEDAEARLRRNPETIASIHQSLSTTVGDREVLADGSLGDPEDWAAKLEAAAVSDAALDPHAKVLFESVYPNMSYDPVLGDRWREAARVSVAFIQPAVEPAPATVPADATGLKGKRARIVGPLADLHAGRGFQLGAEVRIDWDSPNTAGYLACSILGPDGRRLNAPVAASSLALIPEPAAVVEPPVGTRLRDRDGYVWVLTDDEGRVRFPWCPDNKTLARRDWSELQRLGPLHQEWERAEDVPEDVLVERNLNLARREPGGMLRYLLDNQETEGVGPFVAVEEFGAGQ